MIRYVVEKKGDILITERQVRQLVSNGRIIIVRPPEKARVLVEKASSAKTVARCLSIVKETEKVVFAIVRKECWPEKIEERLKDILYRTIIAVWTTRSLLDLEKVIEQLASELKKLRCRFYWYASEASYWYVDEIGVSCEVLGTHVRAPYKPTLLPPPHESSDYMAWLECTCADSLDAKSKLGRLLEVLGYALQYKLLYFKNRVEALVETSLPWRM